MVASKLTGDEQDEVLKAEEVATELRVRVDTVYRWCRNGRLPHVRIGRTI
ncbi:helix-turn-helix domain-containing protein [Planctomycetota bacterium]